MVVDEVGDDPVAVGVGEVVLADEDPETAHDVHDQQQPHDELQQTGHEDVDVHGLEHAVQDHVDLLEGQHVVQLDAVGRRLHLERLDHLQHDHVRLEVAQLLRQRPLFEE